MLFGVAAQAGLFGGLTRSGGLGPGGMLLGRTMAGFAADMAEIMSQIEDLFSWLVESPRNMAGQALEVELLSFVFQGGVCGGMFGAAPFLELRFMAAPAGDASGVIFWKNSLFPGEGSRNPCFGRKFAEPVYFGGGRLDNGENSRVVGQLFVHGLKAVAEGREPGATGIACIVCRHEAGYLLLQLCALGKHGIICRKNFGLVLKDNFGVPLSAGAAYLPSQAVQFVFFLKQQILRAAIFPSLCPRVPVHLQDAD
jgi:hypothetical protein